MRLIGRYIRASAYLSVPAIRLALSVRVRPPAHRAALAPTIPRGVGLSIIETIISSVGVMLSNSSGGDSDDSGECTELLRSNIIILTVSTWTLPLSCYYIVATESIYS